MGTPMEGFFDEANVVAEALTSATPAATQEVPTETPTPSAEPMPVDEGTQTEGVSEPAPIPTETFTP